MSGKLDNRKVAIIGCGFVGSSSAFALMQSGLFSEIALVDVNHEKAEGEALDISHGVPFVGQVKVYATALGEHLSVDGRSVHSFIIGEHGDSEIVAWCSTNISGIPVNRFCEMRGYYDHQESMDRIADEVRNSAYEIIEKKHATYYGIAMSVVRICRAIVMNERSILPVSSIMHGEYGIDGIALSMPAIVGEEGFEVHVPIVLSEEEQKKLVASAEALRKVAKEAGL